MTAPSGLGMWIAYRPAGAVELLRLIGAAWVAPRAGFNGWNDGGLREEHLRAYRAAGLGVFPWIYPTPGGIKSSVAGLVALWETGFCDGLILDAEAEWCGPDAARNALDADAFVQELRAKCPGAWIGHAPMDYLAYHPTFPWSQFGKLDAVMPQVYAYEHGDHGHVHHVEAVERQWAAFELAHPGQPPRWPIGCTYRPKTRGYDAAGKPIPLPAWPDQGVRVAADVAAFLDHPLVSAAAAPSLYSLEACPPEVIAMLAARARTVEVQPTQPDTAAVPLGWQDRAEARAAETEPAPPGSKPSA